MGKVIRERQLQGRVVSIPASDGAAIRNAASGVGAAAATRVQEKELGDGSPRDSAAVQRSTPRNLQAADDEAISRQLSEEREKAVRSGYEQGLKQGLEAAHARIDESLKTMAALLANCQVEVASRIGKIEDDMVELAFVAITRVLGEAMMTREGTLAAIECAAKDCRETAKSLTLRISPASWGLLGEEGRAKLTQGEKVVLVADAKVETGGCLIDMERGSIDARLETQLAKMKQALVDCHAERRE